MSFVPSVDVTVSLSQLPTPVASFGIPLVLARVAAVDEPAWSGDFTKSLTPSTWRDVLTSLGYTSSDDLWAQVGVLFNQPVSSRAPLALAVLGRYNETDLVAQVVAGTITTAAAGAWVLTINDVEASYTASGLDDEEAIRDGLLAALALATIPTASVTGAPVGLTDFSVTANDPGTPLFVALTPPSGGVGSVSTSTPNVGPGDLLGDIEDENSNWYLVLHEQSGQGQNLSLANALETYSRPVVGMLRIHDTDVQDNTLANDDTLAGYLKRRNFGSIALWFHPLTSAFPDFGIVGYCAPFDPPATVSWANRRITGVLASDVDAGQSQNILEKSVNYLYRSTNASSSFNGTVSSGQFIDAVIASHHLAAVLRAAIEDALAADPGLPYTDVGAAAMALVIRSNGVNQTYVDSDNTPVNAVTYPSKAQLSANDRVARRWRFEASFPLQGFLHGVVANVTLTQ